MPLRGRRIMICIYIYIDIYIYILIYIYIYCFSTLFFFLLLYLSVLAAAMHQLSWTGIFPKFSRPSRLPFISFTLFRAGKLPLARPRTSRPWASGVSPLLLPLSCAVCAIVHMGTGTDPGCPCVDFPCRFLMGTRPTLSSSSSSSRRCSHHPI